MKALHTALIFLFLFATCPLATAQNVGQIISVNMKTGSSYIGELTEMDDEKVRINTADFGIITLLQKDIDDVDILAKGITKKKPKEKESEIKEEEEEEEEEAYWYKMPTATHYLIGSTGYTLKKGEMEYQSIWVVFNTFNYGITDNLSLGGGIEILNIAFNTEANYPGIGIMAKYGIPIRPNQLNISVNALYVNYSIEEKNNIGIFYGANTVGNKNSHATLGMGFIVSDGSSKTKPLIFLGGTLRIGQKFSLITESWIMPPILATPERRFSDEHEFKSMISFGGRHIGRNIVADFTILIDRQDQFAIPWVSISIPIGSK